MKSCLLCGVGGQGTVLASRILASAAMEQGLFARTAETIGMAQRGGCVVSHVRFGDEVCSPLIPFGSADLIIGFEPGETVRNLGYLKDGGTVLVCDKAVFPVVASLEDLSYDGQEMLDYLKRKTSHCRIINTNDIYKNCGTLKALNVALVGAAIASGELGLELISVEKVLQTRLKQAFLEINRTALKIGAEMIGAGL